MDRSEWEMLQANLEALTRLTLNLPLGQKEKEHLQNLVSASEKCLQEIAKKTMSAAQLESRLGTLISKAEGFYESFPEALSKAESLAADLRELLSQWERMQESQNQLSPSSSVLEEDEVPKSSELMADLEDLLQVMLKNGGSDLHLKVDSPPIVRIEGSLVPIGTQPLTERDTRRLILPMMEAEQRRMLLNRKEIDFAYELPGARFRVNAFLQRNTVSASIRAVKLSIPTIEELYLPPVIKKFCELKNGLVLVTGPAGSGKSTTLASIIGHMNRHRKLHIVTIEDPIEYIHKDDQSIITQREVGIDTESFYHALRTVLRQDPDVILVGEMRDPETVHTAVMAAETGHLVLSTLHTPNPIQAIYRMLDMFSGDAQRQFRTSLAASLRAIISQKLLKRQDREGRVPAVEVMVATPTITSLISENRIDEIYYYITEGKTEGMQTFTQSLSRLCRAGMISEADALAYAEQPTELALRMKQVETIRESHSQEGEESWWLEKM